MCRRSPRRASPATRRSCGSACSRRRERPATSSRSSTARSGSWCAPTRGRSSSPRPAWSQTPTRPRSSPPTSRPTTTSGARWCAIRGRRSSRAPPAIIQGPPMNTRDATLAKVRDLPHFVGGKHVKGESGRFGDVFNPTTGALAARVPLASKSEVERAVANAKEAFAGWSEISPLSRARVMFRFKELIERHIDELALLVSNEHGKVLSDARGSVQRGLEVVEFACGIPHLMKGEYSDNISAGMDLYSIRQPLGVCAGITPFNFPAMVPMWMFPMPIACGNTFILKPSEKDPSCPLRLAELLLDAGAA